MASARTMLREGMREGDLADLVLPLISIDEFVSKIDTSEAIVVGFYVHDEAAAKDLNRFLQKSAVPLLGTEVSPAPDQHGYFVVFIELMNNDRLAENLAAIVHEIASLVDIDEWQIRVRSVPELLPFTEKNVTRSVARAEQNSKKTAVVEFLQRSTLSNAAFAESILVLEGAGDRYCFDFIDFGEIDDVLSRHQLAEAAVRYDIRSVARSNKIARMLGEDWTASRLGSFVLLHTETDARGLLLKP